MKLARTDKKIMDLVMSKRQGISTKEISQKLGIHIGYIQKKLKKLVIHGILEKINSYPKLYKLNLGKRYEMTFFIVKCPKCGWEYNTHFKQGTKQCENPTCRMPSGKRTRFHITDKRIIGSKRIV